MSANAQFAPEAAEIVALYLNPPVNAVVLSVDEKPSVQAIERTGGYVQTNSGQVVRSLKSTYKDGRNTPGRFTINYSRSDRSILKAATP